MTLKFYMVPGSCSTGIHILLEELELPFEVTVLNMPSGDHRRPAYLAINPKGTIPILVLNGGGASHLAGRHSGARARDGDRGLCRDRGAAA